MQLTAGTTGKGGRLRNENMQARPVARSLCAAWLAVLVAIGCGAQKAPTAEQVSPAEPSAEIETITTESGIKMVRLPGGEFVLGDNQGADDEQPAYPVRVDAFLMDVHEVTQQSYEAFMGRNPAKYKHPNQPVEQIGWYGAIRYCNMRSAKEGLTPCYDLDTLECDSSADGYRLPTEAEWEYACRAGTTSRYSFGDDSRNLGAYAWYDANAGSQTHPVASKQPNPWGLFDMHGNVAEWCHDWYDEDFYHDSPAVNPRNDVPTEERVLRGGSWAGLDDECRSAARYSEDPGLADVCFGYDAYGFRCVRRASDDAGEG